MGVILPATIRLLKAMDKEQPSPMEMEHKSLIQAQIQLVEKQEVVETKAKPITIKKGVEETKTAIQKQVKKPRPIPQMKQLLKEMKEKKGKQI